MNTQIAVLGMILARGFAALTMQTCRVADAMECLDHTAQRIADRPRCP